MYKVAQGRLPTYLECKISTVRRLSELIIYENGKKVKLSKKAKAACKSGDKFWVGMNDAMHIRYYRNNKLIHTSKIKLKTPLRFIFLAHKRKFGLTKSGKRTVSALKHVVRTYKAVSSKDDPPKQAQWGALRMSDVVVKPTSSAAELATIALTESREKLAKVQHTMEKHTKNAHMLIRKAEEASVRNSKILSAIIKKKKNGLTLPLAGKACQDRIFLVSPTFPELRSCRDIKTCGICGKRRRRSVTIVKPKKGKEERLGEVKQAKSKVAKTVANARAGCPVTKVSDHKERDFKRNCANTCGVCHLKSDPPASFLNEKPCFSVDLQGRRWHKRFKRCTCTVLPNVYNYGQKASGGCIQCPKKRVMTNYFLSTRQAECTPVHHIARGDYCGAKCGDDKIGNSQSQDGMFCISACIRSQEFYINDDHPPSYWKAYCYTHKQVWCRTDGRCTQTKVVQLAKLCKGRGTTHSLCHFPDRATQISLYPHAKGFRKYGFSTLTSASLKKNVNTICMKVGMM